MEDRAHGQGCFCVCVWLRSQEREQKWSVNVFRGGIYWTERKQALRQDPISLSKWENKTTFLSSCPSSGTARWWHSDMKDSSAISQISLSKIECHTENTFSIQLFVGREFMENQREDHRREIFFSKGQRLQQTGLSFYPDLLLVQNSLCGHISNLSSLETSAEFSSTSNCTDMELTFSFPAFPPLYLETIDDSF